MAIFPNERQQNDTSVGNAALARRYGGGIRASGDGFGVSVSGRQIQDYLRRDSSDRALIERARGSEDGAFRRMTQDTAQVRGQADLQGTLEGQRAEQEMLAALMGQEREQYGQELAQNTFAAARAGQMGGSANRNREGRLYQSSLRRRLDAQARAAQAGLAQRQQIANAGSSLEDLLASSATMGADFDRGMLGAYQSSRPNMASPLSMQIEDALAQMALQSAGDAAGVAQAFNIVR